MNDREEAMNRSDVLITQGWGRIGYNLVRSLARRGLKVVVGTDGFLGMVTLSRYAAARFQHPALASEPWEFIACIRNAMTRYSPKVYIPGGEETYVVSRYIDELKGLGVIVPVAPFETIRRLHKKSESSLLAKSAGLPVPETIIPRDESDIRSFARHFGFPIVLKRVSSSSSRGVFYLDTDQLDEWLRKYPVSKTPPAEFVVQQYVQGAGHGVSMLFNHGELRAKFTHKRLREQHGAGGVSTVRVGVTDPALEEYAEALLASVDFHGIAMVEFKADERTGKKWFIEVNPRPWGSLALAIESGVDFPSLLYEMAKEGDIAPVMEYESGRVARWILGDIAACAAHMRQPSSPYKPQWKHIRADFYDDFYWDDPIPFLGSIPLSMRKYLATRKLTPNTLDFDIARLEHT